MKENPRLQQRMHTILPLRVRSAKLESWAHYIILSLQFSFYLCGLSYLRFLKSLQSSTSVTYSNPASTSFLASSRFLATAELYSSLSKLINCVYSIVFWICLWPRSCFTYRISLVLWYSVVAFQWRSVWNVICSSLGFWSFKANRRLCPQNPVFTHFWVRFFLQQYLERHFLSWGKVFWIGITECADVLQFSKLCLKNGSHSFFDLLTF